MPTVRENRSNQMERLTTCPICLDKFRLPKVLPCMHTFCLTPCLTNMIEPRARTIRCPECRREHPIPPGLTLNRIVSLENRTPLFLFFIK